MRWPEEPTRKLSPTSSIGMTSTATPGETFVEPYPLQVYGLTCGADGDEAIYCVGGTANGTVERDEVYQLEPVPDGPWTARDPLPDDRIFGNLTYHGGFLYATGGWTHFSQTFIYDLTAGAWSGGDQMNKGRQQALVVSAGGQLWGAAGGDGWTPVTTDEFYQFVDGAHAPHGDWTSTGTAIGIPVVGPVAAYHPSFGVFVIGGRDGASADRADNQLWQICVPDVDLVAPATGPAGTSLTVSGRFFQEQGTAELFGADKTVYALDDLAVVDAQTITATVPADLADGLYGLRVIGEKDQTTEVEDAFEVLSDADDDSADDDTDDVDDDATDDDVSDDDADDDDAADDDDNDDDGGRCGC
ncbi:MAG: hypothetical protein M5R36_18285 [Deltaproteobacteria bacterium]|nr:hypothetical protein [Deltaproteobacteria bacterium]